MPKGFKAGGRTKGTPNKRRQEVLAVLTKTKLQSVVERLFDMSQGVFAEKTLSDGKTAIVYKTLPDVKAGSYLVDQVIGKATQAIEVTDPSDKFDAGKYLTA